MLGTAGGLLFYGDPSGYFVAADERDGKTLWRLPLNATIKTSPMTYAVGGEQFVALAVGSNIMSLRPDRVAQRPECCIVPCQRPVAHLFPLGRYRTPFETLREDFLKTLGMTATMS